MKSFTAFVFSPSRYSLRGWYPNIYPITAADRVKSDNIIISVTKKLGLVSVSDIVLISNTTSTIYIEAVRAFKNGFLVICKY